MSNLTNPSSKHWMHINHFRSIKNVCPRGQPIGKWPLYTEQGWSPTLEWFGMRMQAAGPSAMHVQ